VDDNPADVTLMQLAFRDYGHWPCRLYSVHDGEAAVAFLRQEGSYAEAPRPQLVILDIGLPPREGWQVLETLRATPALATLPVVMLTGTLMRRDEEQRAALQPLACLEKPTQLAEYMGLVAELEQLMQATPSRE
jgi:CheY-like chemotaxis protein